MILSSEILLIGIAISLVVGFAFGYRKHKKKTACPTESREREVRRTTSGEREEDHDRVSERVAERVAERPRIRVVSREEAPSRHYSLDFGSLTYDELHDLSERVAEEAARRRSRRPLRLEEDSEEESTFVRPSRRTVREESSEERPFARPASEGRPTRDEGTSRRAVRSESREGFDYEALSPEEKLEFIELYRDATNAAYAYRTGSSDRFVRLDAHPTGTEDISFNYRALSYAEQIDYLDHLEDLVLRELRSERPTEHTDGRAYSRGSRPRTRR